MKKGAFWALPQNVIKGAAAEVSGAGIRSRRGNNEERCVLGYGFQQFPRTIYLM